MRKNQPRPAEPEEQHVSARRERPQPKLDEIVGPMARLDISVPKSKEEPDEETKTTPGSSAPPTAATALRIKLITEHGTKIIDLSGESGEEAASRLCGEDAIVDEGLNSALAYYIDKALRYPQRQQQQHMYPPPLSQPQQPYYVQPHPQPYFVPRAGGYYNPPTPY